MIRQLRLTAALVLLAVMCACASLGITGPKTFDDKAYAAASTVDQVQKTAAVLVRAHKISPADGENVLKAADAAVAGIAVARSYAATDAGAATTKLDAAIAALTLVQTYLATQGAK